MGQAKQRGSFEERKALAVAKLPPQPQKVYLMTDDTARVMNAAMSVVMRKAWTSPFPRNGFRQ